VSESGQLWDITPQRTGRIARVTRRWRMALLLLIATAALAAVVVPILITGHRFGRVLTEDNPLTQLAKEAQPASSSVFDSGFKNGGDTGFAYGITRDGPAAVLAVTAPAPWEPGPPSPEAADTRFWHTGHLVLTVRADPCLRLERCRPGDTLVYTEVLDIS
jgi:hypothetical protein